MSTSESKGHALIMINPQVIWKLFRPIVWTVVSSMTLPLLSYFVYMELKAVGESQILAATLAYGIGSALPLLLVASILYRAFSADGFACGTLGWSQTVCQHLQKALSQTIWIICPLLMVCESFKRYADGKFSDSLGRLVLMGAMVALGLVMWQAARAIMRFEATRDRDAPTIWVGGGRWFKWWASLLPISLAILAGVGYRFAAEQLGTRILWSLLAGMGLMLGWSLLMHVFDMYRQRLRAQINPEDSSARQKYTDLATNARQVEKVLNVMAFLGVVMAVIQVWADVLPVSELLQKVNLWEGNQILADGSKTWITLKEMLVAAVVVLVAFSFSRNLPGLIELTLPARLPLDKGGRFAITFLTRYLVGLVGLIWASSLLGFNWDRVQWLAAGLTVGLGFGLQEVFANLVSGLIILIERPVRVGDSVSVNNVSGTVTKMALRATTIMDSDRREWIVPNKKFITDDVMNWTLTDTISRAVFPISVAHGSNTRQVHQILLNVARQQSQVLDYPEPSAVLVKIGPQSLDYELRIYLASRSVMSTLQNEILFQLEENLRREGIDVNINRHDPPVIIQTIEPDLRLKRAA
jgi:potassium-dependent mechanosensitive channel